MSENNAPVEGAAVESVEAAPLETQEQSVIEEAIIESNSEEAIAQPESNAETQAELKEEIQEAIEEGATEEQVQNMIKEFTLKVNGKEVTKQLDLSDEEAVKRELQLALAGQNAMQERKELEKAYQSELDRLIKDPYSVLEELGLNPDELAEQRIQARIEEMKKSPEQLERERIERELEDARQRLKQVEEEKETARLTQLEMEAAQELDNEINSALDAYQSLPKTPLTVNRIADTMLWAMENGMEDVTVADVIPQVEKELKAEMNQLLENLPDEMLEQYFAGKHLDRVRKRRINEVKTNNINNIKETAKASEQKLAEKVKEKMSSKDYFRKLGQE